MKFRSTFDIIGPVMIGPSSSHTAGATKIGRTARTLFEKQPSRAVISLYGSFAKTYKGHGTDLALVAGLLGFDTFDGRIPEALVIAEQEGMAVEFLEESAVMEHPNTVKIKIYDDCGKELEIVGVSIGGGLVEIKEINSFKLRLSGEQPAILVMHLDKFGLISGVTGVLSKHEVNISHMEVSRKEKGNVAIMVIEVDQRIEDSVLGQLNELQDVMQVIRIID